MYKCCQYCGGVLLVGGKRANKAKNMIVQNELYTSNSAEFRITIEEDGGFWGKWECLECGERGQSSKRAESIEAAVIAAKVNLGAHSYMKHKK